MELKKPQLVPVVVGRSPSMVRELSVLATDPEAAIEGRPTGRIWNSFWARMFVSMLGVALPFLIVAGLVPDFLAQWGVGPQVLATVLLFCITALVARLMIRPGAALARAVVQAQTGDLTVRVVPGGSSDMRVLGNAFNSMQRIGAMQVRIRSEVAGAAVQLSDAALELVGATKEQTVAASKTSATTQDLARSAVSIAETTAGVTSQVTDVRARISSALTELQAAGDRVRSLS